MKSRKGSGNYKDLDKTRVKLFPNFTRHHLITYTYRRTRCITYTLYENFGRHDSSFGRYNFGRGDLRATWPVTLMTICRNYNLYALIFTHGKFSRLIPLHFSFVKEYFNSPNLSSWLCIHGHFWEKIGVTSCPENARSGSLSICYKPRCFGLGFYFVGTRPKNACC